MLVMTAHLLSNNYIYAHSHISDKNTIKRSIHVNKIYECAYIYNIIYLRMHMGRRAVGRKYAKHISIQVKEEHNNDLKFLAQKLNKSSSLPNGQKWTIRDIVLTLLYAHYDNSPNWYTKNHFEQITQTRLINIRSEILSVNGELVKSKNIEPETIIEAKKKVIIKMKPAKQSMLQIKLNPDYENYVSRIRSIQQEEK